MKNGRIASRKLIIITLSFTEGSIKGVQCVLSKNDMKFLVPSQPILSALSLNPALQSQL